jgi:ABC-type maltose transport system permease subunit
MPWNRFAAMSILYILPLIVIFMLLRKYMQTGLQLGGLKG